MPGERARACHTWEREAFVLPKSVTGSGKRKVPRKGFGERCARGDRPGRQPRGRWWDIVGRCLFTGVWPRWSVLIGQDGCHPSS